MQKEQLDVLLDGVELLEQLIGEKILFIGILDDFAAIEFTNALAFIIPKNLAPPPVDKGYYFGFEELPNRIKKYGILCHGYYIEKDDIVILIAPRKQCKGNIKIKGPSEEIVGVADALMSSLLSMFDDPSGYIRYKNRVLGVLSRANISPLADLAMEKLESLIKAGAKLKMRDDRSIETSWLKKITFGVKPILFNKISIDFRSLERKLAHMKINFDNEISKINKILQKFSLSTHERIIEYETNGKRMIGKTAVVEGKISKYNFIIILAKLLDEFNALACVDGDIYNIALALISKARGICIEDKELPINKLKLSKKEAIGDPKIHLLVMCASLLVENISIEKFKIGKISGTIIRGSKNGLRMAIVIY